jgi:hypothetical protein
MNIKYENKTTNEKRVSLLPLPFDEILAALLQVRQQPKKEKQTRSKNETKRNQAKTTGF